MQTVKHSLWIGTADIKDVYVESGKEKKPFLALLAQLIRKGVEVRLIHAKEHGPASHEDFDRYLVLYDQLERVLCPRVHFKRRCAHSWHASFLLLHHIKRKTINL